MAKRLTELEAHNTRTSSSEPVGSKGMGTLRIERKASGVLLAFYRQRADGKDDREPLGILSRKPRAGTDECSLTSLRASALTLAAEVQEAGGSLELWRQQKAAQQLRRQAEAERLARLGSFGDLLLAYSDDMARRGRSSAAEVKRLLEREVIAACPELARRQAAEITAEDIHSLLVAHLKRPPARRGVGNKGTGHASNGKKTATDRLRAYIRAAFQFGLSAEYSVTQASQGQKRFGLSINPASAIPTVEGAQQATTESLTPAELGELLRLLATLHPRKASIALLPIYLGGQRLSQLCRAQWSDIEADVLRLVDTKGRKGAAGWDHLLPITTRVDALLKPLNVDRLSSSILALSKDKSLHNTTLAGVYQSAGNTLAEEGKTRPFSYCEVRATCETLMGALGVSGETRAWLLSHGRSGIQAKHYDRNAYMPEKKAALEQWGRYLDRLMAGEAADNVHLLTRSKRAEQRSLRKDS